MAPRTKKGKFAPLPEPPQPRGAIKLTKQDVVRRELATAIRLFVTGGDPVAVYVLASAASGIINPAGQAKNVDTWRVEYLDYIKDEYREAAEHMLDEPFNFMKHGKRDLSEELTTFSPLINNTLLFMLCRDYWRIYRATFPELVVYMTLQIALEPKLVKNDDLGVFARWRESVEGLAGTAQLDLNAAAAALTKFDEVAAQYPGALISSAEAVTKAPT